MAELRRFDHVAQRDRLAMRVGHFDSYRRFSWDALDQNRFGTQRKAQIIAQPRNAAVLDARLGLELERRDHRAGIDLRHLPIHFKFLALEFYSACIFLQLALRHLLATLGRLQQSGGGKPVCGLSLCNLWFSPAPFRRRRRHALLLVGLDDGRPGLRLKALLELLHAIFKIKFLLLLLIFNLSDRFARPSRDALRRHRRASCNLDLLYTLLQALRLALLAPILDAREKFPEQALWIHRLLGPCEPRMQGKTRRQEKGGKKSHCRNQNRAYRIERRSKPLRQHRPQQTAGGERPPDQRERQHNHSRGNRAKQHRRPYKLGYRRFQ